jgi:Homeodomain-like domain
MASSIVIKVSFTEEEIRALRELEFNHPHPLVRRKALVLLLKSKNLSTKQTSEIVGVCENTVCNYMKTYQDKGIQVFRD